MKFRNSLTLFVALPFIAGKPTASDIVPLLEHYANEQKVLESLEESPPWHGWYQHIFENPNPANIEDAVLPFSEDISTMENKISKKEMIIGATSAGVGAIAGGVAVNRWVSSRKDKINVIASSVKQKKI